MRIAQASSSENFTRYGKAPNQRRTGASRAKPEGNLDGELNVVNWSGGWTCVYRAIDPAIGEKIATFAYRAVANGNYIGYSWSGNTGVFDALKAKGSTDPMDIDTLVNCDCATLVGAAVYYSGIHNDGLRDLVTWKMDEVLMKTNAFVKLASTDLCEKGKGIQKGDILLKEGHTAVAIDSDSSPVTTPLVYFQTYTFKGVSIDAGTSGTRAKQLSRSVSKSGYKIIDVRKASVSNSALCMVDPFLGGGEDKTLYVNFYRASGAKGTIDCSVKVVYVRADLCN